MLDIGQIHRTEYELVSDRSVQIAIAEAPGRIHFLGEHGDPADGLYLSAAIDRFAQVAVNMRKDNFLRFYAADFQERKRGSLVNFKYRREDRWANYLKIAVFVFLELGVPLKGLNFTVSGNIPQQIGLASSTAIETASAVALRKLLRVHLSDESLAQKLHKGHLAFFNSGASLADYQTCLLARKEHFLVIDASAQEIKRIKSPFSRFRFLLVDSRVPRIGVENELSLRRNDALKGLGLLSQKSAGSSFRDFASSDLLEVLGNFPEQIRRRSMHIVQELRRVMDGYDALERGDIAVFSRIIFHSHESLRDLYEVSCPEIDWLVKRAQEIENTAGSRMIGHGFGGCTYAIIPREMAAEYRKRLEDYERIFGFRPVIYEVKIASGSRTVPKRKKVYANTAHK
ncbi:MAG: galactokinase [Treponema sp.]|jgi:galactokinase|nr:galactokinase [Treponema sp.]